MAQTAPTNFSKALLAGQKLQQYSQMVACWHWSCAEVPVALLMNSFANAHSRSNANRTDLSRDYTKTYAAAGYLGDGEPCEQPLKEGASTQA